MIRLPDRERSRVVLIGTARLDRPDLPDLPSVRYALPGLADALADPRLGGIAPVNVRIVLDPESPEVAGLDLIQAAGHATDLLLVYLAGHLIETDDDSPALALPGGRRGRGGQLTVGWIARTLATSRAAVRVLVVDGHLAGAQEHRVRQRGDSVLDGSVLVALSDRPESYAPRGRPGTALSRTLLDLVYRRDTGRPQYLLPTDLADAAARELGDRVSFSQPAQPPTVALFRSAGAQPPVPHDLHTLSRLAEVAGDAERLGHRAGWTADRYRDLAVAAHRVYGPEHPETLRLRHRLAHWTGKAGDVATAVALYTELRDDRLRLLGVNHPHTRGCAADLAYWAAQPAAGTVVPRQRG
jgi:hypothetical protein